MLLDGNNLCFDIMLSYFLACITRLVFLWNSGPNLLYVFDRFEPLVLQGQFTIVINVMLLYFPACIPRLVF